MVMRFFKIVASPVRSKSRMCSHPRTGDAIAEKNRRKKSREFQWVEFLATKSRTLSPSVATTARRRRDNCFKKSHHHRQQNIARVAAALELGLFRTLMYLLS